MLDLSSLRSGERRLALPLPVGSLVLAVCSSSGLWRRLVDCRGRCLSLSVWTEPRASSRRDHGHRNPGLPVRARPHANTASCPCLPLRSARVADNWGLALVKTRLDQRRTDLGVQVPWTLPELRREWNRAKNEAAPWWAENSKEAYSSGLDGPARALRNWSESRSGRRRGRPVGFPQFKKKGRCRRSRLPTARRPSLAWTSASVTWPCSLLARLPSRTHELWNDPPASFAGSTGNWLVDAPPLDDGSSPGDG